MIFSLNKSQDWLAGNSSVAKATIASFELGKRSPIANKLAAIRATLEAAGVILPEDGEAAQGAPGVRLHHRGNDPIRPVDVHTTDK